MNYIKYTPFISNNWMRSLNYVHKEKPHLFQRVLDSFTESQLESKLWLNNELNKIQNEFNNVAVIGGWYCHVLTNILIENFNAQFVCNYDIDKDSKTLSYKFNKKYKDDEKYYCSNRNLFSVYQPIEGRQRYQGEVDLLINTSCEHMYYMKDLLKRNFTTSRPLCVLQSTDNDEYDDHINCVKDPEELAEQADLVDVKYMGTKKLSNGMNRFMVIGR
tara:strand:- start:3011 stop:3661 length:651 start_codon:yes stop_codon:yes gene_type:complete